MHAGYFGYKNAETFRRHIAATFFAIYNPDFHVASSRFTNRYRNLQRSG